MLRIDGEPAIRIAENPPADHAAGKQRDRQRMAKPSFDDSLFSGSECPEQDDRQTARSDNRQIRILPKGLPPGSARQRMQGTLCAARRTIEAGQAFEETGQGASRISDTAAGKQNRCGQHRREAAAALSRCHALSVVRDPFAVGIGEAADGDEDEVDQRPDAASSEREELYDTGADFTDVEAMNAQSAQEEAKQEGCEPIFLTGFFV